MTQRPGRQEQGWRWCCAGGCGGREQVLVPRRALCGPQRQHASQALQRGGRKHPGSSYWGCRHRAGPCGAPGCGSFSVSPVSCLEGIGFSLHDLPGGQVQTAATSGKGRDAETREQRQETTVQPWGRILPPPQGRRRTMSLSSSAEQKPPRNGRC